MAIRLSSGFPHLQARVFHTSLKTHKTQDTQPRGWKKRTNNHGLGLAPSARWEEFVTFLESCASLSYREHAFERNSHPATRNADSYSHVGQPSLLVHRPKQSPFSDCRLSPTSVDCSLLLTALFYQIPCSTLGPCLPSSFSSLVGDLGHKCFVWVSRQNRQKNLTGSPPHPQPQKGMPNIVPQTEDHLN